MKIILKLRNAASRYISRMLLPHTFSIISDDCWGGQIYRQYRIQYSTPTVGLYINIPEYINFLRNIKSEQITNLQFLSTDKKFPVARTPYAKLYFMHYNSVEEAKIKFSTRYNRIKWSRLLVKIDFGRPGVRMSDIEEWNSMKIPNSIALYSPNTPLPDSGIYNGLLVSDWVLDGAKMFNITRKHFNIYAWINKGDISLGWLYKFMNILLFDPSMPRCIANKVLHLARR